jgi:pimeloyl-ACP methyl ester carboxylesterase
MFAYGEGADGALLQGAIGAEPGGILRVPFARTATATSPKGAEMTSHYDVLGVSPEASAEELERAYGEKAELVKAGLSFDGGEDGASATKALDDAWQALSDPESRRRYDGWLARQTSLDGSTDTRRSPRENECDHCGSSPAAEVTLRYETGKLLWRTRHWIDTKVCRRCGIALFRRMQNRTLLTSWWGIISFFVNWTTVVRNLAARRKIGRLSDPRPNPHVSAALPAPMDLGRPVFLRPGFLVLAVVVGWLAMDLQADSTSKELAGRCIVLDGSGEKIKDFVSCADQHDARVVEVVSDSDKCLANSDYYFKNPVGRRALRRSLSITIIRPGTRDGPMAIAAVTTTTRQPGVRRRLVCLHGVGGGPADFSSWRAAFPSWDVVVPDLQRAVADLGRASMEDYAAEAAAGLAGVPGSVLSGWSMGGLVALMVAARHPVAGLVLIEPSLPGEVAGFDAHVPLEEGTFHPDELYGPRRDGVPRPTGLLVGQEREEKGRLGRPHRLCPPRDRWLRLHRVACSATGGALPLGVGLLPGPRPRRLAAQHRRRRSGRTLAGGAPGRPRRSSADVDVTEEEGAPQTTAGCWTLRGKRRSKRPQAAMARTIRLST